MIKNKKAFSIIELSIVAIIISVIIASVLASQRLFSNASLSTAQSLTKSSPVPDIDNLALWLETTMPQSFTNLEADDNKTISTWYDLSPNKNNAVQATSGNRPTYKSGIINDLPALYFNGANANQLTIDFTDMIGTQPQTIFIVFKPITPASNAQDKYLFDNSPNCGSGQNYARINLVSSSTNWMVASGYTSVPNKVVSGGDHIYLTLQNGSSSKYRLNGAESTGTVVGAFTPQIRLGSGCNGTSVESFTGYISEFIIFDSALKQSEILAVEQYLSQKWNITIP